MRKLSLADLRNKNVLAFAGNAILSLFGIVIMALLYRSLSKADVGAWFFFLTIYSLSDAVRNGFLQTACVKFYSGTDKNTGDKVLGSVWYLALVIAAVVVGINLVALPFLRYMTSNAVVISVQWLALTFLSAMPFTFMFWTLVAEEKYGKIMILRLVNSGSMIIYIAVLIATGNMTLQALLWCNFLTNVLTSLVGSIWGLGKFYTFFKRDKAHITELFHFGKYSFGSTVTSRLLSGTDAFIITFIMGPATLAVYNMPQRLMEIVEMPLRTFTGTGMSAMANALNQNKKEEVVRILNKYAGLLTIAFIPLSIAVLFLANVAIYLIGGAKYTGTEAANIYRIFMVLCILYPIDRFTGITLDIIHKPKINFYKVLVMLACAFSGDLLGYGIFRNIYGFAFGSFITVGSGLIFAYFHLNRYLKFSIRDIVTTGYAEAKMIVLKTLKKDRTN